MGRYFWFINVNLKVLRLRSATLPTSSKF